MRSSSRASRVNSSSSAVSGSASEASSGTASRAGTSTFAKEFSVSSWMSAMSAGATFGSAASRSPIRVDRHPWSHSVVRKGVELLVTAWFAVTMTPSGGSSAQGSSVNSTKPCQS